MHWVYTQVNVQAYGTLVYLVKFLKKFNQNVEHNFRKTESESISDGDEVKHVGSSTSSNENG